MYKSIEDTVGNTPLVRLKMSDLTDGAHVIGDSLAELGRHSSPLDMILYSQKGEDFLLVAPRRLQHGDFLLVAGAGEIRSCAARLADALRATPAPSIRPATPPRGGDTDQIKAVASGEAELAVGNTYYFATLMRSKKPEDRNLAAKVGVIFPNQANRGTHVNISGGSVAKHAPNKAAAVKFLEYLVSVQAQRYFAEGNSEYPVVAGVELSAELMSLGNFKEDQLNARVYAQNNADALKIMERAGWK